MPPPRSFFQRAIAYALRLAACLHQAVRYGYRTLPSGRVVPNAPMLMLHGTSHNCQITS